MNPVVHFEMPAKNKQRMCDFYGSVFGWNTQQLGAEMSDYVLVTTTETDEKTGRPKTPGAINGGFYARGDEPSTQNPSFVISVDNIDEHIKKITAAGGKILHGPTDIQGIGKYVSFEDTEGNRASILQPLM